MVIYKYLARRFFLYTTLVSILFATLVTFVAFFEKIVRCQQAILTDVLWFLGLNFLPNLVDFLPVSIWLATCLLLKDLWAYNEWDLMQFLGFIPRRLFIFAAIIGTVMCLCTFVAKESFINSLGVRAEHFKMQNIKKQPLVDQRVTNIWTECADNMFCYIGIFDGKTQQGTDLSLLKFQSSFDELTMLISAPHFSLNIQTKEICIPVARQINVRTRQETTEYNMKFHVPMLFMQIGTGLENSSLIKLFSKIIFCKNLLPSSVYGDLVNKLMSSLSFYMQLLFYPFIMFGLVLLFGHTTRRRWLACVAVYPLFSAIHIFIANASVWWIGLLGILLYPLIVLLNVVFYFRAK